MIEIQKLYKFQTTFQSSGTDQFWRHLFHFGNEVCEELCHVLLLPGVEGLLVHGVCLTERPRVIRFALALLQRGGEEDGTSKKWPQQHF